MSSYVTVWILDSTYVPIIVCFFDDQVPRTVAMYTNKTIINQLNILGDTAVMC